MARLARILPAVSLLVLTGLPPSAHGLPPAERAWCRGVTCSGHGTCMVEGSRPFCFCDDGYAAEERECVAVREPASVWASRRSMRAAERAVEIAIRYRDNDASGVGADLRAPPWGLRHYVWRGEQWCTDFVSWVYRAAGIPLTGGSHGGWMIGNNLALREWFRRHDLWVDHESRAWASFEPRPGDYVRFHTQSGVGHSGIVRRAEGDTLYTVEGNVGNRVRLRRFRSFRDDRRIDGIGMLTLPAARATRAR